MNKCEMISQKRLMELLEYNKETGVFTWRTTVGGRAKSGTVAGTTTSNGYILIYVDKKPYLAHRLAWLYVYGELPSCGLDHKDMDRCNNRIENLRKADKSQNNYNRNAPKNNACGLKGVYYHRRGKRWASHITIRKKNYHLGLFDTKEEAYKVRCLAAAEFHGEFARYDRINQKLDVLARKREIKETEDKTNDVTLKNAVKAMEQDFLTQILRKYGIVIASLKDMEAHTRAVACGELKPDPSEAKLWFTSVECMVECLKRSHENIRKD